MFRLVLLSLDLTSTIARTVGRRDNTGEGGACRSQGIEIVMRNKIVYLKKGTTGWEQEGGRVPVK